ncbi:TolC family protein [Natroniella sulfidigena]|uniref:TolC family protein n=1 Tax=Natroniella sulfidigena TaxID=723921 RepID=UPI00200B6FA8|nr:TolC family protein [Natroniella sulfidigena]MCK8815775.1 TolC family protein [Natroniella sulfidigena]
MQRVKLTSLIVLLVLAISTLPAFGADSINLTEEKAIELALENNSQIESLRREVKIAQKQVEIARASFYPQLDLGAGYTRLGEAPFDFQTQQELSQNRFTTSLDLELPLYTGGQRSIGYQQAEKGVLTAQKELEEQKKELAYQVSEQYYSLLEAEEMVQVSKKSLERIEDYVQTAEVNYEVGIFTRTNLLQAQTQKLQAEQGLLRARNGAELAELALKNTLKLPRETEVELVKELDWEEKDYQFDKVKEIAFNNRLDLELLELNREVVELNLERKKGEAHPNLFLSGNYEAQDDSFTVDGDWRVSLGLSYNLYDGGERRAELAQIEEELDILDLRADDLKDLIELEVEEALLKISETREGIKLMELSLEKAEENLKESEANYQEGLITTNDLLEAEATYQEVQSDYLSAIYDYNLAVAKLYQVKGIGR